MSPLKCKFWVSWMLGQNSPNFSCHFSNHVSVPLQIWYHSLVLWHITPLYFFASNIIYFRQKWHIKVQIFRLATACIKTHQIPHAIFGTKSQLLFKLFCTFSSKTLYALDKRSTSKCKFSDFRLLDWKLTKFLISFFKPQVCFSLNFASPFSVMTHNFSESF